MPQATQERQLVVSKNEAIELHILTQLLYHPENTFSRNGTPMSPRSGSKRDYTEAHERLGIYGHTRCYRKRGEVLSLLNITAKGRKRIQVYAQTASPAI